VTFAWLNDVAFMGTFGTSTVTVAVDGPAEVMGAGVDATGVDVVMDGVFAHLGYAWVDCMELASGKMEG
jgi:hypothetical protein